MVLRYVGKHLDGIIHKNHLYAITIVKHDLTFSLYAGSLSTKVNDTVLHYPVSRIEDIYSDWDDNNDIYRLIKEACRNDLRMIFRNWKIYIKVKRRKKFHEI